MNLYIFAEHEELTDFADQLFAEIAAWAEPKTVLHAILRTDETEATPVGNREMDLGVEFTVSKTQKLKEPLNFLYPLAKKYQCEFVVGVIEDGKYADVCYFGFEEGRPDLYEIANYVGLES